MQIYGRKEAEFFRKVQICCPLAKDLRLTTRDRNRARRKDNSSSMVGVKVKLLNVSFDFYKIDVNLSKISTENDYRLVFITIFSVESGFGYSQMLLTSSEIKIMFSTLRIWFI